MSICTDRTLIVIHTLYRPRFRGINCTYIKINSSSRLLSLLIDLEDFKAENCCRILVIEHIICM